MSLLLAAGLPVAAVSSLLAGSPVAVLSSLPEGLPAAVLSSLLAAGDAVSEGESVIVTPSVGFAVWTVIALTVWIAIAIGIGRRGQARGQSFGLLVAVSLILSPLVALVLLLVMPQRRAVR